MRNKTTKITVLLIAYFCYFAGAYAAISTNMSARAENAIQGNIYITGAAFGGWDSEHPQMMTIENEAEGIYTWTGNLQSGEFKFLLTPGQWTNCLNAEKENEKVELDKIYTIVHVPNYFETGGDYPFIIQQPGRYTITVDITNMTMIVTDATLKPFDLWLTGSAVKGAFIQMLPAPKGTVTQFRYFGYLESGELKFTTQQEEGEEQTFFVPIGEDIDLYSNSELKETKNKTERGFTVVAPDYYFIYIDTDAKQSNAFMHSKENIYIVGGAASSGWDCFAATALSKQDDAPIYTYEGELRIRESGEEPNLFKFLGQKDWGPVSFHPQIKDESIINCNTIVRNSPQDHKWSITEEQQGYYTIKLNILSETMEVVFHGETPPSSSTPALSREDIHVFPSGGALHIQTSQQNTIESALLWDISGRLIAHQSIQSNSFSIGENLKGVYVLKLMVNGIPFTDKIIMNNK